MRKGPVQMIAKILVVIGALNWGLVAINSNWDVVAGIFGGMASVGARIVYGLVGLSGLVVLWGLLMMKKM
jgi:uncharacterized membrane protein YuzA (DUF378 family)